MPARLDGAAVFSLSQFEVCQPRGQTYEPSLPRAGGV